MGRTGSAESSVSGQAGMHDLQGGQSLKAACLVGREGAAVTNTAACLHQERPQGGCSFRAPLQPNPDEGRGEQAEAASEPQGHESHQVPPRRVTLKDSVGVQETPASLEMAVMSKKLTFL